MEINSQEGLMLHSTTKKKGTLYKRYLGGRDGKEGNVHEEDEITSAVLGPLDFLADEDVFLFWTKLLGSVGHSEFFPTTRPLSIDMKMWNRRTTMDGVVEPDVVVEMEWPDDRRTLLIEMKWHAPLSGEDQLHRQWSFYLEQQERDKGLHLLIAPDIAAGLKAKNKKDVWQGKLVLIQWLKIRSILGGLKKSEKAIGRWANHADYFLERIGVQRFDGFSQLKMDKPLPAVLPPALLGNFGSSAN